MLESKHSKMALLNNRQIAAVVWIAVFVIWVLSRKNMREVAKVVLNTFLHPKVVSLFIVMTLYIYVIIALFAKIGLWEINLYADTIFWYLGSACVLLINVNKIHKEQDFFYRLIRQSLALIVILEVLVSLYSFSLLIEIALVLLIFFLTAMRIMAERDKKYQAVKNLSSFLLSAIGFLLLIFTLYNIASDVHSLFTRETLHAFITIPLLTFAYLPYLYFVALLMEYELLFLYLNRLFKLDSQIQKYAKLKIVLLCNVNLRRVHKLRITIVRTLLKADGEFGLQKVLSTLEDDAVSDLKIAKKYIIRASLMILIAVLLGVRA